MCVYLSKIVYECTSLLSVQDLWLMVLNGRAPMGLSSCFVLRKNQFHSMASKWNKFSSIFNDGLCKVYMLFSIVFLLLWCQWWMMNVSLAHLGIKNCYAMWLSIILFFFFGFFSVWFLAHFNIMVFKSLSVTTSFQIWLEFGRCEKFPHSSRC